jgi:hypothetical protein
MPTDVAIEQPGTRDVRTQTVLEDAQDVGVRLRGATDGRAVLTGVDGEPVEIERRLVMWYRSAV